MHALGDGVRAGIGEGEYVVELETLEVNLAHEHVVDRAQAAAQRPGTLIALAHGIGQRREVDRHGHLEAHHLPRVGEVVDATVKDAVVRALVLLDVDHAGEIGATGRREETPHLDGDLHVLC